MTHLVALGGTGLIGSFCMKILAAEPLFAKIYSVGRRPLALASPRIEERVGSMQELPVLLKGVQAEQALCTLGTTIKQAGSQAAFAAVDRDLALQFARLVKHQGVKHFHVVSSLGADRHASNFYLRVKGELEAGLEDLGFEALHIYRPSLLLGPRQGKRLGEEIGALAFKAFGPLLRGPLLAYRPIEAEAVAQFIVEQMRKGEKGLHIWENRQLQKGA